MFHLRRQNSSKAITGEKMLWDEWCVYLIYNLSQPDQTDMLQRDAQDKNAALT